MRRCVSALAVAVLLAAPTGIEGQDADWNRYTLESLGGVFIRIEANDVCEGAGVMASSFEASTSLRLIEAEVGVLTMEEMLEHPAMPELRVTLDCATGSGGAMAYSVALRVQQAAQMLRDTQITLPEAVTWFSTKIGVTPTSDATSVLEDAVAEKLGEFVEAWNAVNAEEEGGPS